MNYPHVSSHVYNTPWATTPDMLDTIERILEARIAGDRPTPAEVEARVAHARRAAPLAPSQGSIAVLPLMGLISQRMSLMSETSGGTTTKEFAGLFQQAVSDPQVSAIVMHVDSPGGAVHGVPELADVIAAARGTKPIIAAADAVMASAAYWIAAAADEIVATPSAMVGGIGVLAKHRDLSGKAEREGVKTTTISAGTHKADLAEDGPLTTAGRAEIQRHVNVFYGQFVAAVARGRGVSEDAVRTGYGEGRVLTAEDALSAGLVDRIEPFEATVRRLLGVSSGGAVVAAETAVPHTGLEETTEPHVDAISATVVSQDYRERRLRLTRAQGVVVG